MNNVKNAALTSLTMVKEAANPEQLRAGFVAAAEKSKELAGAAPGAAGQVRPPACLFFFSSPFLPLDFFFSFCFLFLGNDAFLDPIAAIKF